VPLIHVDELIGFALLGSPPEPFKPNYEDRDLLKTVGRHVAVHLQQFEAARRLAESRQFEAYHRLTAFVMHDLKNLAAQLALIVSNAEKHKRTRSLMMRSTIALDRPYAALDRAAAASRGKLRHVLCEIAQHACEMPGRSRAVVR
jgi:hypothetical protein